MNRRDQLARQTVNKEITDWDEHKNNSIEPAITLEEWRRTWFIYKNRSESYDGEHSLKNANLQFTHFYLTPNVLNGLIFCSTCNKRLECKNMTSKKNGKDYGDVFIFVKGVTIRYHRQIYYRYPKTYGGRSSGQSMLLKYQRLYMIVFKAK